MTESKTITYKEIASIVGITVRSVQRQKAKWELEKYRTAHRMPVQFWRKRTLERLKTLGLIE